MNTQKINNFLSAFIHTYGDFTEQTHLYNNTEIIQMELTERKPQNYVITSKMKALYKYVTPKLWKTAGETAIIIQARNKGASPRT